MASTEETIFSRTAGCISGAVIQLLAVPLDPLSGISIFAIVLWCMSFVVGWRVVKRRGVTLFAKHTLAQIGAGTHRLSWAPPTFLRVGVDVCNETIKRNE